MPWKHSADALVMNCIDFRLVEDTAALMTELGLAGRYDNFVLAGAALGVLQNQAWRETFDANVDIAVSLHFIRLVIVVDHMDCGYYKAVYYNQLSAADQADWPKLERRLHHHNLIVAMRHLQLLHPTLEFQGWLMELDGTANRLV